MNSPESDTVEIPVARPANAAVVQPASIAVAVDLGAATHAGLVRPNNEDSYLVARADRSLETLLTNLSAGEVPAWAAERSGSQLTLELPEDQFNHAHEPWQVLVFVTLATGDEIQCGTLGELINRVLRRLGVTLLILPGTPKPLDLDARLAPVINRMLRERVWRIADFSGLRPRRGYLIDEEFSTLCYRSFGNRYFSRMGSLVTTAIRKECERWETPRSDNARQTCRGFARPGRRCSRSPPSRPTPGSSPPTRPPFSSNSVSPGRPRHPPT